MKEEKNIAEKRIEEVMLKAANYFGSRFGEVKFETVKEGL